MAMESFIYFAFALIVMIVVFLIIKKITGCIIKTAILLIVAAVLAYVYFNYFKVSEIDNETGETHTTSVVDRD